MNITNDIFLLETILDLLLAYRLKVFHLHQYSFIVKSIRFHPYQNSFKRIKTSEFK